MPLARVTVSVEVDDSKKKDILRRLSLVLAEKLAKPEKYVQTVFEAGVPMSFAGTFEPAAFLEIKSIGGLTSTVCRELCESCCGLLEEELRVSPERVYIVFSDVEGHFWGWNKTTFG